MKRTLNVDAWLMALACVALASCAQSPTAPAGEEPVPRSYEIVYTVSVANPGSGYAQARIDVVQDSRLLRELRFSIDPERHGDFAGDGEIIDDGDELTWRPQRRGGTLTFRVILSHQRGGGAYDALMTENWALFRGGDVFPPAAARTVVGAESRARLEFELPDGWSALTPYLSGNSPLSFPISNPDRRYDRPTGWILTGRMGVRRGNIGGTRVAIGAPMGEGVHRMDIMAFLRWTLPALRQKFPTLDERLIIVSAGDPMWRGGLSGPGSLFIHSDRPMISENGTSSMLHELVHVAMGVAGPEHDDWLVEGLAEYYSIKILLESGTMPGRRNRLTLADLEEWGEPVDDLFVARSAGPVTARAVTLLASLDEWLAENSRGRHSLDDVVLAIIESGDPYSYRALCDATNRVARRPVPLLAPDAVPGAPAEPACVTSR